MEFMDSNEMPTLSPYDTWPALMQGIRSLFLESYGVHNLSSLTANEFLRYKLSEIENFELSQCIREVNACAVIDPHYIIRMLQ